MGLAMRQDQGVKPDRVIDRIGKLVGLVMSVAFVIFAMWCFLSGRLEGVRYESRGLFYALMIILGGPIPYFFASSADKVQLTAATGKAVVVGGYAIAVVAVLLAVAMPPDTVWYLVELNNLEEHIEAQEIHLADATPDGAVYPVACSASGKYRFVCRFPPDKSEIRVLFKIEDPFGPRRLKKAILREGAFEPEHPEDSFPMMALAVAEEDVP